MTKIKDFFRDKKKQLQTERKISNILAVPVLKKITINVGIGKTKMNPKFKDEVAKNLALLSGQKPKITLAKKAIAGFKIHQKDEVGLVVTLRGQKMEDFSYKLANIVLPRMRDFRGLDPKCFDKNGNFTLALREQIIFPEISHEQTDIIHGMSITFTTTAKNSEEGQKLLEILGFPFKKNILKKIN